MVTRLLEQVYVRVEGHFGDALNPNTSQPWTRLATSAVIANPRDMASSQPFWAVPLILARRKNDATDPMRFSLTDQQLSDLRDIEQPKWPTKPDLTCGVGGATAPNCCP